MTDSNNNPEALTYKPKASVIISVYKDIEALNCILEALYKQTEKDFEIIVTEDCESPDMASFIQQRQHLSELQQPRLYHLSQQDIGFRKTRAVNRAIAMAKADYLIFLDGDCIPHFDWVKRHLALAKENRVLAGRRVHLGKIASKLIRRHPNLIHLLENRLIYTLLLLPLHLDHMRNFEIGFSSTLLQKLNRKKQPVLVGCNFSCHKKNMMQINGYNEDLPGAGGEDDDLCWRFAGFNIFTMNVKFLAIVYHLYHDARRIDVSENLRILRANQKINQYVCKNGIIKYDR
ncbi:MAG: glycosyltransferase [Gammaproteobacteria bacterium]|nr:glycosyltransferase [Gammaproteobacteria bacterium]